jgi:hypothetical protein
MLAWGKRFERGMLLKRRGGWYRAPKKCFGNAYRSVQEDPARYVYCEGFCWASSPFEHAWLIERQGPGAALDPTLGLTENYSYLGIPIRWEYVKDIASRRGIYGSVFDWYLQPEYPIFSGVHAPDIVIETV